MTLENHLTQRLLAEQADREAHPLDWQYTFRCRECGLRQIRSAHKNTITQAREAMDLAVGTALIIIGCCEKCDPDSGQSEQEEAEP